MSTIWTPTGVIEYSQDPAQARLNAERYVASRPPFSKRHSDVDFQRAALKAWREAEGLLGRRLGKGPWKFRRARAIRVTGTGRSYDLQAALYIRDPRRYAKPWVSGHVQKLSGDVNTEWEHFDLAIECLERTGWQRVRPGDEPWHVTWGVKV